MSSLSSSSEYFEQRASTWKRIFNFRSSSRQVNVISRTNALKNWDTTCPLDSRDNEVNEPSANSLRTYIFDADGGAHGFYDANNNVQTLNHEYDGSRVMFLDSCIITPNCNNDVEKCEKVDSGTIKSIGNNRIEEKFYHPRELNDNVGQHEMLSNSKLVFEKQTSSNTIVTEEEVLTNVLCNGTSTDVEYKILETPNNEVTKNDENDGVENDASKISDNNDVLLTGNAEINFVNIVDGSKYCNDNVVVGNRANESSDEVEHELIPTVSMDHDTLLQIVPPRYPLPHCTSSTIPMNTCYRGRFFMVLERILFNITRNTFKRLSRCINRGSEHNITAECISRQRNLFFKKRWAKPLCDTPMEKTETEATDESMYYETELSEDEYTSDFNEEGIIEKMKYKKYKKIDTYPIECRLEISIISRKLKLLKRQVQHRSKIRFLPTHCYLHPTKIHYNEEHC